MTMEKVYPLFLRAVTKDYIWGGTRLNERYGRGSGPVAESWELWGGCPVENGELAGKTFAEAIGGDFPLLVKLLDAREKLSVQVHPSDADAEPGERGKEEFWYILEAKEGSFLYCGLKRELSREELRAAALDGSIEQLLHKVPVSAGDCIYIAPGIIHALGAGILTAEIQQNSDTTFRLYDYGRGRNLHLERGCAVAKRCVGGGEKFRVQGEEALKEIIQAEHFRLRELCSRERVSLCAADFQHLLVLEGQSRLVHSGKNYELYPGASVFLPAGLGEYSIEGPCRALITEK